jgi:hypothetical protein
MPRALSLERSGRVENDCSRRRVVRRQVFQIGEAADQLTLIACDEVEAPPSQTQ